jgi:hypothetical protein
MRHRIILLARTTQQTLRSSRHPLPRTPVVVDPPAVAVSVNRIAKLTCESEASRLNLILFTVS